MILTLHETINNDELVKSLSFPPPPSRR